MMNKHTLTKKRTKFGRLSIGDRFYHKFTDNYYQKIDSEHGKLLYRDMNLVYVISDFMLVYKVMTS